MTDQHRRLLEAFYAKSMTETQGMERLQDEGVVSDNCVWVEDIHWEDLPAATKFIEGLRV